MEHSHNKYKANKDGIGALLSDMLNVAQYMICGITSTPGVNCAVSELPRVEKYRERHNQTVVLGATKHYSESQSGKQLHYPQISLNRGVGKRVSRPAQ
jgi:hypothetical protein